MAMLNRPINYLSDHQHREKIARSGNIPTGQRGTVIATGSEWAKSIL
jgi:hypothetical protein